MKNKIINIILILLLIFITTLFFLKKDREILITNENAIKIIESEKNFLEDEIKKKDRELNDLKEFEKVKKQKAVLTVEVLALQKIQINQEYKEYKIIYIYNENNNIYNKTFWNLVILKKEKPIIEVLEFSKEEFIINVQSLDNEFNFIKW